MARKSPRVGAPTASTTGLTLAESLARRIGEITFAALPAPVVAHAKRCLLDQIGVQLRGATLPLVEPARRLALALGGRPDSRIVLHGDRTTTAYAAYVNSAYGHSCEFDDAHPQCGHPGVCVIPTALAVAEARGLSGRDLIAAVVAGYDTMALALGPIHGQTLAVGWHGMKVAGVFGAAAVTAKLMALDQAQTTHALAIAASDASGTMEYDQSGGEVKRLHGAMAARSGVQAAILAQAGMTGPATIFEGRRGIHRLFGTGEPLEGSTTAAEAGTHAITSTIFKLYPSVGTNHAALDALRALIDEHRFAAGDVAAIAVGVGADAVPKASAIRHPNDVIGAQTSLAFNLALRLVKGGNDLGLYSDPGSWTDPAIRAVVDRVEIGATEFSGPPPRLGANVVVTLTDGRRLTERRATFRGHPDDPASDDDIRAKFESLVTGILSPTRAEQVVSAIDDVETLDDVAELVDLLVVPRG